MPVTIAVLGDRNVDFLTHREIDATLALVPADVDARWLPSPEAESAAEADGLWVVPGTPYRDDGAVLEAIHRARTAGMPILGTCGGFQYMTVVEFARNAAGIGGAAHAETEPEAPDPVVARLSCSLVGEERQVTAVAGTRVAELCGTAPFTGPVSLVQLRARPGARGGARRRRPGRLGAGAGRGCRGRRAARPSLLPRDALPAPGGKLELRSAAPADRGADLSRGRDLTRLYAGRVPPASSRRTRSRESAKRTAS